ncbi:MAG: STAS/SEC14 domain-containing protein [Planctomycetota bacterium]
MLQTIAGLGPDVVAFEAEGVVTAEDYAERLVPAVEELIGKGRRPRFLYVLGPSFERFSLGALIADSKVGLSHLTDFDRIAVVTDNDLIEQAVRAFGLMIPCPVRTFAAADLAGAKTWVAAEPADAFDVRVERDGAIARVHARLTGSLDLEAEDRLLAVLGDGLGDATDVRVLVEADDFHGWRGVRALWHHLRFVVGNRRRIDKVAIVGEARWQRRLVGLARHVLRVEARFFEAGKLTEAKAWLDA